MRLNLILPKVEPTEFEFPKKCPRKGCWGMRYIPTAGSEEEDRGCTVP